MSGTSNEEESNATINAVRASNTLNETETQGDLIQWRDMANTSTEITTLNTVTTTTTTTTTTTATGRTTNRSRQPHAPVERRVRITHPTGQVADVPEWIAVELATTRSRAMAQQREAQQLKQQMAILANSTRINEGATASNEPRTARNVNFQDTFELRYLENNSGINEDARRAHASQLDANAPAFSQFGQIPPATSEQSEFGGRGNRQYAPHFQNSWQTADRSVITQRQVDVGHIVRQWHIKFTGEKGSSIEEFIQRVDECRRLVHMTDEDLLNSLTELLSGVALHWCRQSRCRWRTWNDFCAAARRCYGVDRRFQQRLMLEAQNRTQGKDEPVRDYIICLLTIMSRLEEPWALDTQLDLLHKNKLPELQRLVRRNKVNDVDELLELARDAEALLDVERSYKPPPSPEQSLLPEVAYKATKNKSDSRSTTTAICALTPVENGVETLEQMNKELMTLMQQLLAKIASQPKSTKKDTVGSRSDTAKKKRRDSTDEDEENSVIVKKFSRSPTPKSDKNKDREPGPRAHAKCWDCSWPGYTYYTCPECSGNEKRGE